ncbi:Wound-induced basic protein [Bienertia sinuspersici]
MRIIELVSLSLKYWKEIKGNSIIYDVNSYLFRSFLSQKGGTSEKRKWEEQKPKDQRPKASENNPVMNE